MGKSPITTILYTFLLGTVQDVLDQLISQTHLLDIDCFVVFVMTGEVKLKAEKFLQSVLTLIAVDLFK